MTIKYIKSINKSTPIDIIIPAAGMGKRMKSYGPKSLIKIGNNKTILDNQLKILNKFLPGSRIILICGFESNLLMNNSPNELIKIENENYATTNVVRSIGMGLRACSRDTLIVYGDLVFNEFCIESVNLNKSSILVGDSIMDDSEIGCVVNNKSLIENMMYDLNKKWGQMIFLKNRELKLFKEIVWDSRNYNMFGFEAINQVIARGGNFLACENTKARVIDIDISKDLERVEEII